MQLAQGFLGVDDAAEWTLCVFQPELCIIVGGVIITAAAAVALNNLAKRLYRVTASCHVIDFSGGFDNDIGIVTGVGVGTDFRSAQKVAYATATANMKVQYWRPGRQLHLKHCQYD
jgi:hypothetical protein